MFGGIIDAIGTVAALRPKPFGRRLVVRADGYWNDLTAGASVAVDGVCLTIVSHTAADAEFDVITETLRRSTLGQLTEGNQVNLQKCLRVGDRVDGHFVQGHVDAVGTIVRVERTDQEVMYWLETDLEAMKYVIPKGGICIDGISLTIAAVTPDSFSVALIPTTLSRTTIGGKKIGGTVNIETDILARTVIHQLSGLPQEARR